MTRRVRLILVLLLAIGLGFAALAVSSLLPGRPIARNIAAEARLTIEEPRERQVLGVTHMTDPYTDALIMNTSIINAEQPIAATMVGANYAGASGDARVSLVTRAENGLRANDLYPRFWHGYVALLRPAFSVVTYAQWRVANLWLLALEMLALLWLTSRRLGVVPAFIVAVALVLSAPTVVGESLQFSPVVHLSLLASIVGLTLIRDREAREFDAELFMGVGAATAFFDLFTAPLLTLGLPLALLVAYRVSQRTRASEPTGLTKWQLVGRASGGWAAGYAGMWAAKWIYALIAVDKFVLVDVAHSAVGWLGPGVGFVDRWTAFATNLEYLAPATWWPEDVSGTLAPFVAIVVVLAVAVAWMALSRLFGVKQGAVAQAAPLLAVATVPIGWLMIVVRHAADAAFMEYRTLLASVVAGSLFFVYTIDWRGGLQRALASSTDGGGDNGVPAADGALGADSTNHAEPSNTAPAQG